MTTRKTAYLIALVTALLLIGCGGSLSYTVDQSLIKRLPKSSRRSVFQAETVVTIAVDQMSTTKRQIDTTRREIARTEERIENLKKRQEAAAAREADKIDMEIDMLWAKVGYQEDKIDHLYFVLKLRDKELLLAKALGEYPYVNAHIVGDEIHQMASINIGLAVDTERGLIVPVLKGVNDMLLADVTRASHDLVGRARQGRLLPDDLQGGTFTLSNMGAFDVEASTPILNLPQCAILGVGRIATRPAAYKGELCLRQTVTLSLTYDHRAIDGAPAARFLERVKHLVEQPHLALVR